MFIPTLNHTLPETQLIARQGVVEAGYFNTNCSAGFSP